MAALLVITIVVFVASMVSYNVVPVASFTLPLLLGSIVLRYRPLFLLVGVVAVCAAVSVTRESTMNGWTGPRLSNIITLALVALVILYAASRYQSGLPGPLGEAMLVELNDRLQVQGVVPPLPKGWRSQSAVLSAGGAKFAGDFLVANLSDDKTELEMVLVDVCGKGVGAGTQSLQFAGALGGLIGSLPPLGLFSAANDFLLRSDGTRDSRPPSTSSCTSTPGSSRSSTPDIRRRCDGPTVRASGRSTPPVAPHSASSIVPTSSAPPACSSPATR